MTLSARKQAIASHFAQANNYNQHAQIQASICDLLISKLNQKTIFCSSNKHLDTELKAELENVLEIGAGQGLLTQKLAESLTAQSWHINELCAESHKYLHKILPNAQFYFTDAEGLEFLPASAANRADIKFDLITSANTVQWFDNPLSFVTDASRQLKTGGQLLFSSFTSNNFKQIKQLTGQGLHYPSTQEWLATLNTTGFDNIELTTHAFTMSFASPMAVLKHIKHTGVSVNNSADDASRFRWTRESLQQFEQGYKQAYSTPQGQVELTYEALMVSAIASV